MTSRDEERIGRLIKENREQFDVDAPHGNHMNRFMVKLSLRVRHFINITPYLVRVGFVTIAIFVASVILWDNCIRKDRHDVPLKNKIHSITSHLK